MLIVLNKEWNNLFINLKYKYFAIHIHKNKIYKIENIYKYWLYYNQNDYDYITTQIWLINQL